MIPQSVPLGRSSTEPVYGAGPDTDSSQEYWRIFKQRKWTLLLAAALGLAAGYSFTRTQSPGYRARALIEIANLNYDFLNTRNVNPTASEERFQSPESVMRTPSLLLQSRPVIERALSNGIEQRLLGGKGTTRLPRWRKKVAADVLPAHEQAIRLALDGLRIRPEPNTRILEISFESADPRLAADFTNSLAASFIEVSRERRRSASETTSAWLNQQLREVRTKLENAEGELQQYASGSDLTFISDKDNSAEDRLRQLQLEYLAARNDRVLKQSLYELTTTAPPESLPQVLDDLTLKEYNIQLATLRRQLADLESLFTPENPKVVRARAQIAATEADFKAKRSDIVTRVRNDYTAASRREVLLNADYVAQTGVVSKEASRVAHYAVLKREVDTNRLLYDSMLQRVREAGLVSAMPVDDIHILEGALPPLRPFTPNGTLDAIVGLISGSFAGLVFVIWRARSYSGIQEPGQIAIELQVPELGTIPANSTSYYRVTRLLGKAQPQPLELTTWQNWPSALAESFRFAVTSILLAAKDGRPMRVIALTSANPGEGKTSVISNLAIALARTNRRVLLIDGDMRRPRLHQIFDVDNSGGLSEILTGDSQVGVQATKIPNLFVLPSGRSADESLPFSAHLRRLVRHFGKTFDMVLIDTPPILKMSDARLISHVADAVVLVVAQHTDRSAVRLARQHLAEDGSFLLGTILNNWNRKTGANGYRHYAGYENDPARNRTYMDR